MSSHKDYKWQRLLGSGNFGRVFLANKNGKSVAIKKIVNTEQNTAQQEIKILKLVDHEKIIKYYDHFMEKNVLCIVLEYANVGTMTNAVKTTSKEDWNVWRIICHLSDALDYLHSRSPQILHHDLKPDNILGVTEPSKCSEEKGHRIFWKLADFGVAKMLTKEAQEAYFRAEAPGVPTYMGPEVLRDFETYSAASDVWSLGCTIGFLMRNGKHVFNSNVSVLQYKGGRKNAGRVVFESKYDYSSILVKLVYAMIQVTKNQCKVSC